jgi:hypothetical protein
VVQPVVRDALAWRRSTDFEDHLAEVQALIRLTVESYQAVG